MSSEELAARGFVKIGKDGGDWDVDLCARNNENVGFGLLKAAFVGHVCATFHRVDHPGLGDAHGDVVLNALEGLGKGIVLGENLDAEERGSADEGRIWVAGAADADVGYTVVACGDLNALLGVDEDVPVRLVVGKEVCKKKLYA